MVVGQSASTTRKVLARRKSLLKELKRIEGRIYELEMTYLQEAIGGNAFIGYEIETDDIISERRKRDDDEEDEDDGNANDDDDEQENERESVRSVPLLFSKSSLTSQVHNINGVASSLSLSYGRKKLRHSSRFSSIQNGQKDGDDEEEE